MEQSLPWTASLGVPNELLAAESTCLKPGSASGLQRRRPGISCWLSQSKNGDVVHGCSIASASSSVSPEKKRPGTGRFYSEELSCFRRLPTPSPLCSISSSGCKEDWTNQPLTGLRRVCSDSGIAFPFRPGTGNSRRGREVPKGELYGPRSPVVAVDEPLWDLAMHSPVDQATSKLPLEDRTASVLEQIYPKASLARLSPGGRASPARSPERDSFGFACASDRSGSSPGRLARRRADGRQVLAAPLSADERFSRSATRQAESRGGDDPRSSNDGSRAVSKSDCRGNFGVSDPSLIGSASGEVCGAGVHTSPQQRRAAQGRLLQFRQKLLDKFQTVKGAFENFATESESGLKRELNKKQFGRFLNNHFAGLTQDEHSQIFEFLDGNKNGHVSILELHTAIEASAPVRTLEDLRRKWIALGFTAMRQAIQAMNPHDDRGPLRRFSPQEFGALLARVGVEEEDEQQAIFAAIADPNDNRGTVSIDQLTSAVAAVSPSLLLEDIRERLLKRFGDLDSAYSAIDQDRGEGVSMTHSVFMRYATEHFKMTPSEARKAFELIDVDRNRTICRTEFLSALRLSEPTLFLEELRRKVRQRFRSIAEAFQSQQEKDLRRLVDRRSGFVPDSAVLGSTTTAASDGTVDDGVGALAAPSLSREEASGEPATTTQRTKKSRSCSTAKLESTRRASFMEAFNLPKGEHVEEEKDCGDFAELLESVQLTKSDTQCLFDLVDIDRNGRVSSREFTRGIRLFAPACMLEDLRLYCLRNYGTVANAFKNLSQDRREAVLDLRGFEQLLIQEVGVPVESFEPTALFGLLESRRDGGVTVGELVSALQSSVPGSQVPLTPEQRGARARQQIRWQLAPFRRSAGDLRGELRAAVRQGLHEDGSERVSPVSAAATDLGIGGCAGGSVPSDGKRMGSIMAHVPTKQSYKRLTRLLREQCETPVLERMHGYYASAESLLAQDIPLFRGAQNRFPHHRSAQKHRVCLASDAPLMAV